MTHYDALGAEPTATASELRLAYRRAARAAHPDRHGDASSAQMATVNEAWRVLGDADRRRRYDADLAAAERDDSSSRRVGDARSSPYPDDATATRTPPPTPMTYHEPARFPWRFMAVLLSLGVALIVVGVIVYDPPPPAAPDGILRSGDCVMLTDELEAVEVGCGNHDAVVNRLIPFDQVCPTGTQPYRDRQGMGTACVVRSEP